MPRTTTCPDMTGQYALGVRTLPFTVRLYAKIVRVKRRKSSLSLFINYPYLADRVCSTSASQAQPRVYNPVSRLNGPIRWSVVMLLCLPKT